jgi:hypothetical protein
MLATYTAKGNTVILAWFNGEAEPRAKCDDAEKAARLLNKAMHLNDTKRKYTAAARTIAQAESLPGFRWMDA